MCRDDQLSTDLMGDIVLLAELDHLPDSADRQARLDRAGLVVDAGMQHPAVIPGLVPPDRWLFLEHGHPGRGEFLDKPQRGGKSDDSSAHHQDSVWVHSTILKGR